MKNIPFATNYYVSEDGKIFSNKSGKLKEMRSNVDTSKYKRLGIITNEGKKRHYLVHRLVAICYLPNPLGLPEVNHKDGDKLNNHYKNLEWVTREENQQHAFGTGLNSNVGKLNGKAILDEEDAVSIYRSLLEGQLEKDLAVRFNVDKGIIKKIKYKATWQHVLSRFPDIPVKYKSKSISDSTATWICTKLQEGLKVRDILSQSTNDRITESIIWDIKRGRSFKHIAKDFSW